MLEIQVTGATQLEIDGIIGKTQILGSSNHAFPLKLYRIVLGHWQRGDAFLFKKTNPL